MVEQRRCITEVPRYPVSMVIIPFLVGVSLVFLSGPLLAFWVPYGVIDYYYSKKIECLYEHLYLYEEITSYSTNYMYLKVKYYSI